MREMRGWGRIDSELHITQSHSGNKHSIGPILCRQLYTYSRPSIIRTPLSTVAEKPRRISEMFGYFLKIDHAHQLMVGHARLKLTSPINYCNGEWCGNAGAAGEAVFLFESIRGNHVYKELWTEKLYKSRDPYRSYDAYDAVCSCQLSRFWQAVPAFVLTKSLSC